MPGGRSGGRDETAHLEPKNDAHPCGCSPVSRADGGHFCTFMHADNLRTLNKPKKRTQNDHRSLRTAPGTTRGQPSQFKGKENQEQQKEETDKKRNQTPRGQVSDIMRTRITHHADNRASSVRTRAGQDADKNRTTCGQGSNIMRATE